MSKVRITYRGWPGHFVCADRCHFHLNTLIEYRNIKIVVSTVGLMAAIPLPGFSKKEGFEQIGYQRHFETMAFHAKKDGEFWDADVSRQISFKCEWTWSKITDEAKANAGHIAVVDEICAGLLAGETYRVEP